MISPALYAIKLRFQARRESNDFPSFKRYKTTISSQDVNWEVSVAIAHDQQAKTRTTPRRDCLISYSLLTYIHEVFIV